MEICPGCRNTHTLSSRRHNQTQRATDTHTYKCTGWTHRRNTQIHPRHIQPETHTWTLAHEFTPKETPCRERHRETQRYIQETTKDRGTPKQTETLPDLPGVTPTKPKAQTCLERGTPTQGCRHTEMCAQIHPGVASSPLPSPGRPLPRTHNPPCSHGRCPHAGTAGPGRGPPPAHSSCLCGPLGTCSSGSCPCPHTAHQPDTAAPAAPLCRREQGQAHTPPPCWHQPQHHPMSLLASVTRVSPTLHRVVTHPPKRAPSQSLTHIHKHLRCSHELSHTPLQSHPSCLKVTDTHTALALAGCHTSTHSATHPIMPVCSVAPSFGSHQQEGCAQMPSHTPHTRLRRPLTDLGCGLPAGQALDVTEAAAPPRGTKAVEGGPGPGTATPVLTGRTAAPVYQRLEEKTSASALGDPLETVPQLLLQGPRQAPEHLSRFLSQDPGQVPHHSPAANPSPEPGWPLPRTSPQTPPLGPQRPRPPGTERQ